MAPKVDKNLCIGCGTCVSLCPDVFAMGEDNKSQVKEGADFGKNKECIEQSVISCPSQAISLEK